MNSIYVNYTDVELWALIKDNDQTAFNCLYKRHIKSLYNFGLKLSLNRELIKDTLQELFTEFWNKRRKLSDVQHIKVYLIKAFRYKLLRAITQTNKKRTYTLEELFKDFKADELTESEISFNRKKDLKEKLQQLSERQKEVIHLKYFQNLRNDEIADILNVNYQSVSNILHRSITKLRKEITLKK